MQQQPSAKVFPMFGSQQTDLAFSPLAPRSRRSTSIASELRRMISSGQLQPGDQLPTEAVLCRQFGVSRTTLREAIQMLRTSGLLDVTPGRGSFVRTPDLSQLLSDLAMASPCLKNCHADIAHMHALIQRDVLTRLSRLQPAQRGELHRYTLNRMATAEDNAEMEANWHLAMARLSGNTLAHLLLQTLMTLESHLRVKRFQNPDEVMRTIQTQMRINAALVDGDFALAERVLMQYINPQPPTHGGYATANTYAPAIA